MSDTVDDLHEAEDRIGGLTLLVRRINTFAHDRPWTGLADASGYEGYEHLIEDIRVAANAAYCRPSCLGRKTAPCVQCGGLVGFSELEGFYHVDCDPIDGHDAELGQVADERGTMWDVEVCDDCCGCPCGHHGADDTGE